MPDEFDSNACGMTCSPDGETPYQELPLPKPGHDACRAVLMLQATRAGDFGKAWLSPLDLLEGGIRRQDVLLAGGQRPHGRASR